MSPVEERVIAAGEGEICPKCGERKTVRVMGSVGTMGQRMVIGVEERSVCGCTPVPLQSALARKKTRM